MFEFANYKREYKQEVLLLLKVLWKTKDISSCEKYFGWKYESKDVDSKAFVVIDKNLNRIVGFRGLVDFSYRLLNERIVVSVYSDAIIDVEYRRKGLFKELNSYAEQQVEHHGGSILLMAISSSKEVVESHLKNGCVNLGTKRMIYKLVLGKKKNLNNRLQFDNVNEIRIRDILVLDNQQTSRMKVTLDYSESFLKWRYSNPNQRYYFIYAYENGKIVGYLSYFFISPSRVFVFDYLSSDFQVLDNIFQYLSSIMKSGLIQMWGVAEKNQDLRMLNRIGFYELKMLKIFFSKFDGSILAKFNNSFGYSNVGGVSEEYLSNIINWRINLINSDGE